MSAIIQFDIFEPKPTEIDFLRADLKLAVESSHKVRKGTYASINELKKRVVDLESKVEVMERYICSGKYIEKSSPPIEIVSQKEGLLTG